MSLTTTKIQIKRSTTSAEPPSVLSFGELAYVNNGLLDDIYIGDSNGLPVLVAGNKFAKLDSPALTGVPTAPTPLSNDNSTSIATTAFVQNAITDELSTLTNVVTIQGTIDCSGTPLYPIASKGHLYVVSVAGRIGGASGPVVEVGDQILCTTDSPNSGDHNTVGSNFVIIQVNISAAVSSSTAASGNHNIAFFDGLTGRIITDLGINVQTEGQLINSISIISNNSVIKDYVDSAVAAIQSNTYFGSDSIVISAGTNIISARLKTTYSVASDCNVIKVDSNPDDGPRGLYVKTDGLSLRASNGALYVYLVDGGTF